MKNLLIFPRFLFYASRSIFTCCFVAGRSRGHSGGRLSGDIFHCTPGYLWHCRPAATGAAYGSRDGPDHNSGWKQVGSGQKAESHHRRLVFAAPIYRYMLAQRSFTVSWFQYSLNTNYHEFCCKDNPRN